MSSASPRRLRTRLLGGVAVGAASSRGPPPRAVPRKRPTAPTMDIQILSFNDFHGNLEPPTGSSGRLVTDHCLDVLDPDRDGRRRPRF